MNYEKDLAKEDDPENDCDDENLVETSRLLVVGVDKSAEAKSQWNNTTTALNELMA
jgi:hypothetical protein